ncbi:MAG: protein-export chaperone SecB [Acholeplasma sp.]|nr:protein-export chaperone SecB [Acholeplasma sp.]
MLPMKRMNIVVTKMELINKHIAGTFQLNHRITRHTGKIADQVYYTELRFEVLDHADTVYPINLVVHMRVNFEFHVAEKEETIEDFLKSEAVTILYPYLRATITQLTTLALIPPVVIPVIDPQKLFKEDGILN